MAKKTIEDIQVNGKTVLVRVDFNVPMEDGRITDDNRIRQAIPTLKYLLDQNAKVVCFSHLGRIKSEDDKAKNSLRVVSETLSEQLNQPVTFIPETRGETLENAIKALKTKEILMFENTRFEDIDGKRESKNDPELGRYWASLGDVFVNDAFGTAHRAHASNVGIASNIEVSVAGKLLEKEIDFLGGAIENPKRPFVAILGGAKVSDKIGVIRNLLTIADMILVGGGMSYTFLKAQGFEIGTSLVENDKIELAKSLLDEAQGKIVLPKDYKLTKEFSNEAPYRIARYDQFTPDEMGLDVGTETIEMYKELLSNAQTVVWNGPVGVFEFSNYAEGTKAICEILGNAKDTITIIGGGDSASAAINFGYEQAFTHISTGGGASLEYLEGKDLPGVSCLSDR